MNLSTLKPYEHGRDPLNGYVTRDGRKVRILATDLGGKRPIAIAVKGHSGDAWEAVNVSGDGIFHTNGEESCWDILCVPVQRTVWMNVYANNNYLGAGFKTKDEADANGGPNRIACVLVTFTEGEGL